MGNLRPVSGLISIKLKVRRKEDGKTIYVEEVLWTYFRQVVAEANKAERMIRKRRDREKKGHVHFCSLTQLSVFVGNEALYIEERTRQRQSIVSKSVPIHSQWRPDERWKANTGDCHKRGQQGNRETRQKTPFCSWVCLSVHGRLVPEASSSPANPSWELCSPRRRSNHLFLPLSSALPPSQKHPLHGS